MSNDDLVPPPPPSSVPPPPPSDPPVPTPGNDSTQGQLGTSDGELTGDIRKDNPIALAALVVALLGLLLAIVIIGGVVGLISLAMAVVALRRAKITNSGRGFAFGAIALSLFAIVASAGALTLLITTIQDDDFDLEALFSNSPDDDEFPPEEDILSTVCTEDGLALATITVDNPTDSRQLYRITVTWDSTSGALLTETLESDVLEPGEQGEFRIFQRSSSAIVDSCAVSDVRRTVSLFE